MTRSPLRRSTTPALVLLTATLLMATACSSAPQSTPDSSKAPDPVATSPTPTPSAENTDAPAADPQCDTIIPAAIVADFEEVGWTARAEEFRIGEIAVEDGIQCVWGDFSTATDHVQIFGWAPISEDDAADAQSQLVEAGWRKEVTPEGVIVTEAPETALTTDAEGYGLTYLFGEGWVKYADTKQGLLLVVWPAAS